MQESKILNFIQKWLIISKKPFFTGIQTGFQTKFTTFERNSLDMPIGILLAQPPAHSIEKE